MKMKWFCLAALFLVFLPGAWAQNYNVTSHEINVNVDRDGFSDVSEKYYLVFDSKQDADEFAEIKNNQLKFDFDAWEDFDETFRVSLGSKTDIAEWQIDFADEPSGNLLYYVEFQYSLDSAAFVASREETGRIAVYQINKSFVRPLSRGADFVIPEGTTLSFILPQQSEATGSLVNNQKVRVQDTMNGGKRVVMPGYISSIDFDFGFSYARAIAPSFSIAMFVKNFSENSPRETQITIAVVAVIALIVLYVSRNRIEKRITAFIIRNSDLTGRDLEENRE